ELERVCHELGGDKADDAAASDRRDSRTSLRDRGLGEFEYLGMRQQVGAVTLIRERRPPEDVRESGEVSRFGGPDADHHLAGAPMPTMTMDTVVTPVPTAIQSAGRIGL